MASLYEKFPNEDFCGILIGAKEKIKSKKQAVVLGSGGNVIEVYCYAPEVDSEQDGRQMQSLSIKERCLSEVAGRPSGYSEQLLVLRESSSLPALEICLEELETDDADDLAEVCSIGFNAAIRLSVDYPTCKTIALRLGRRYMERLPEIVESKRRDWGLPNMNFPSVFAKFLEDEDLIGEAVGCLQTAVMHGVQISGALGYKGRLDRLLKKHKLA